MATHSSILAWKIPWTVEPGRLQPLGSGGVEATEHTHPHRENRKGLVNAEEAAACLNISRMLTLKKFKTNTII